jgi:hypothetical protein
MATHATSVLELFAGDVDCELREAVINNKKNRKFVYELTS